MADEFARSTQEYDEAHGLYLRRGRFTVVSPGDTVPRGGARRLGSVAHPGIERERLASGVAPTFSPRHYGITGAGQGCDIAEFQSSTPSGFSFYIIRLLNENGREDLRWRMHKANVDAWGAPSGAYGIVAPYGPAPSSWANSLADLLGQARWAFIPTIDVELGDAGANRAYVATAAQVLRNRGYGVVMGYYSTGGAYRFQVQDLVDRHWGAAWGSAFPAGFDVHQWQGSPLDRDYSPDFGRISGGNAPPPPGPPPYPIAMVTEEEES